MSMAEKTLDNALLTYKRLLIHYYVEVYKTRKCQIALDKLYANRQLSTEEYISYIPRMEAKIEVLAEVLQRNYQEDLSNFNNLW